MSVLNNLNQGANDKGDSEYRACYKSALADLRQSPYHSKMMIETTDVEVEKNL